MTARIFGDYPPEPEIYGALFEPEAELVWHVRKLDESGRPNGECIAHVGLTISRVDAVDYACELRRRMARVAGWA